MVTNSGNSCLPRFRQRVSWENPLLWLKGCQTPCIHLRQHHQVIMFTCKPSFILQNHGNNKSTFFYNRIGHPRETDLSMISKMAYISGYLNLTRCFSCFFSFFLPGSEKNAIEEIQIQRYHDAIENILKILRS